MSAPVRVDHLDPESARTFIVNWCMSSICNYTCSYCSDALHDHRIKFPEVETVIRVLREVKAQRPGHRVAFDLTGGEVTAWPKLLECLGALRAEGALISILSNGSRPISWWEKAVPLLDKVVLSFHSEFASFDHFLELARFLSGRVAVHVNVLAHPRRFGQCLSAARILSACENVSLALQPVLQRIDDPEGKLVQYTRAQLDALQDGSSVLHPPRFTRHFDAFRSPVCLTDARGEKWVRSPQELLAAQATHWAGWTCWMGLEQMVVQLDGSVFGGWCHQGACFGNVNQGGLALPTAPTVCGAPSCSCYFDIQCTKERPAAELSRPAAFAPSPADETLHPFASTFHSTF